MKDQNHSGHLSLIRPLPERGANEHCVTFTLVFEFNDALPIGGHGNILVENRAWPL